MITCRFIIAVVALAAMSATLVAQAPAQGAARDTHEYTVSERGPHHRKWEKVTEFLRRDGTTGYRTNSYTQLATGMHYLKDGQWTESNARFQLFPGGASAEEGPFKLIVAPDVAQAPVLDLMTPDGKRFQSSPRWLTYHDRTTGQSVMIAAVKPCIGELIAPNVILFPDAFDDIHAALRITYQIYGMEQEVLFLESGPLRPEDYGLPDRDGNVVLEMWSEFHTWPEGGTATASVESGLDDVKLDWGESQIGIGKAFALGEEENSIAVGKSWVQAEDQRQFLIEAVRQADLAPLLARLPLQAQANNPAQRARGLVQHKISASRSGLIALGTERLKDRERRTQTAAIHPSNLQLGAGVTIDYSIITTISNLRLE